MKRKKLLLGVLCLASIPSTLLHAQTLKTWTGGNGDFFDPLHWSDGTIPGTSDIAEINDGSTATIDTGTTTHTFGDISLGSVEGGSESGHVIMNSGTLILGSTAGDPKAVIGLSAVPSSFIMNGGTILFDGPDSSPGNNNFKGINELDWEVGEKGIGHFEMHSNAVFRASDDFKIAENAAGTGSVIVDGNARISVGSGISISSGGTSEQSLLIGGNAVIDSGNSMGAGNASGGTDEGYLTMAINSGHARLVIQDKGILNIRRLSSRAGTSTIIVKDEGQFNIFDVLNGKGGTDMPAETGPNSTFSSEAPSDGTIILQDNAQMNVNSAPESGPVQGLGISAPRDSGNAGGTARLIVKDSAKLNIKQDLDVGSGFSADTSDGTIEIQGPNASVTIGGNLNLGVDTDGNVIATDSFGNPVPGKATFSAVITGSTHTTMNVTGTARIANGILKVRLAGPTPPAGTTFTLIQGGTVDGEFATSDFSSARLPTGLKWETEYSNNSVKLKVVAVPPTRVVTVTTEDNAAPGSLLAALNDLQEGDLIKFNIPGAGPHFISTPAGGYPLITVNNVIIDGYSQPGAVANSNPILGSNNAQIQIVLDSRNGNHRLLDFDPDASNSGYGDTEAATIGVYAATNVTISGVSILSPAVLVGGSPNGEDVSMYGISFAKGGFGHISGCWIGIAPDRTTLAGPACAVTGFRYRFDSADEYTFIDNVIFGVQPGSTNAPAEFNVITGVPAIPVILEGNATRISGNFINVFPNGTNDFNPVLFDEANAGVFEGNIEIGRAGNNTLIGVDGDGVNDSNERNIFSGVAPASLGGYDHNIEFYGQTPGTNVVVAGNYFGIGVDGQTRFTNGVPALNAAGNTAQYRFGSDIDGVSDDLEGNVVYNNWPADLQVPSGTEAFFDELSATGLVSARGNTMVNNFPFPTYPGAQAGGDSFFNTYYSQALLDVFQGVVPTLSTNSTTAKIIGTVPLANKELYPTTVVDLYIADPEGMATGQALQDPLMTNGYVQGRVYLGSFVVDSIEDQDKAPGAFAFDISGLNVPEGLLTITANYSQAPVGVHNALTLTSPFSDPIAPEVVEGAPTMEITRVGNAITISWTGSGYKLQTTSALPASTWTDVSTTGNSYQVNTGSGKAFFRLIKS